ncbi:MAG: hypothetical protein HY720_13935 [Planctomycetes bacterium]|nr:hypothetical protein [Planctomycetota bacterium]
MSRIHLLAICALAAALLSGEASADTTAPKGYDMQILEQEVEEMLQASWPAVRVRMEKRINEYLKQPAGQLTFDWAAGPGLVPDADPYWLTIRWPAVGTYSIAEKMTGKKPQIAIEYSVGGQSVQLEVNVTGADIPSKWKSVFSEAISTAWKEYFGVTGPRFEPGQQEAILSPATLVSGNPDLDPDLALDIVVVGDGYSLSPTDPFGNWVQALAAQMHHPHVRFWKIYAGTVGAEHPGLVAFEAKAPVGQPMGPPSVSGKIQSPYAAQNAVLRNLATLAAIRVEVGKELDSEPDLLVISSAKKISQFAVPLVVIPGCWTASFPKGQAVALSGSLLAQLRKVHLALTHNAIYGPEGGLPDLSGKMANESFLRSVFEAPSFYLGGTNPGAATQSAQDLLVTVLVGAQTGAGAPGGHPQPLYRKMAACQLANASSQTAKDVLAEVEVDSTQPLSVRQAAQKAGALAEIFGELESAASELDGLLGEHAGPPANHAISMRTLADDARLVALFPRLQGSVSETVKEISDLMKKAIAEQAGNPSKDFASTDAHKSVQKAMNALGLVALDPGQASNVRAAAIETIFTVGYEVFLKDPTLYSSEQIEWRQQLFAERVDAIANTLIHEDEIEPSVKNKISEKYIYAIGVRKCCVTPMTKAFTSDRLVTVLKKNTPYDSTWQNGYVELAIALNPGIGEDILAIEYTSTGGNKKKKFPVLSSKIPTWDNDYAKLVPKCP